MGVLYVPESKRVVIEDRRNVVTKVLNQDDTIRKLLDCLDLIAKILFFIKVCGIWDPGREPGCYLSEIDLTG